MSRHASPGPTIDCTCTPQRGHGQNHHCYRTHRCRCAPCLEVVNSRARWRRRQTAYGRPTLVDAAPVRAHANALRQLGWSATGISTAAGLPRRLVGDLPRQDRTSKAAAEAVLALPLTPPPPAGRRLIPARATMLRARALYAAGWPLAEQSRASGVTENILRRVVRAAQDTVRADDAAAVAVAYERLWDQAPPPSAASTLARGRARRRGWVPPLGLDDDRLDDPDYVPDVTVLRRHTPGVDWADVEWMIDHGADLPELCARLGITRGTLRVAARRAGRTDLWDAAERNAYAQGRREDPPAQAAS